MFLLRLSDMHAVIPNPQVHTAVQAQTTHPLRSSALRLDTWNNSINSIKQNSGLFGGWLAKTQCHSFANFSTIASYSYSSNIWNCPCHCHLSCKTWARIITRHAQLVQQVTSSNQLLFHSKKIFCPSPSHSVLSPSPIVTLLICADHITDKNSRHLKVRDMRQCFAYVFIHNMYSIY